MSNENLIALSIIVVLLGASFIYWLVIITGHISRIRDFLEYEESVSDAEVDREIEQMKDDIREELRGSNVTLNDLPQKPDIIKPAKKIKMPAPTDDAFHFHPDDEPKYKCVSCKDRGWFLRACGQMNPRWEGPYQCHCYEGKVWKYDNRYDYGVDEPWLKNHIKGYPGDAEDVERERKTTECLHCLDKENHEKLNAGNYVPFESAYMCVCNKRNEVTND